MLLKPRKSPYFQGMVIFSHSNMDTPGKRMSANLALAVINRSLHTINSHLDVSLKILAVLLMSLCWLIRQLPARFRIILISLASCTWLLFSDFTPSSSSISWPRTTASVHKNTGIFLS